MQLGIFGGSFDPIHNGHLTLALCCLEQATLDEVWFMPAAGQPLKPQGPQASGEDRCAMIELAIAAQNRFRLCRLEIDRRGLSYTVESLRIIHADRPADKLYFLMGADSLADLPNWYEPREICRLSTPLVVHRAGEPDPDYTLLKPMLSPGQWQELQHMRIDMPEVPVSSSEIRRRVGNAESTADLLPENLARYIAAHHLYRNDTS